GYYTFHSILRSRSREVVSSVDGRFIYSGPIFQERRIRSHPPLLPLDEPLPLDIDEVASVLEHGGPFSRHFPEFEYRPQQVDMLRGVAQALSEGRHLLVEAGTGTGKSMAYLIPA